MLPARGPDIEANVPLGWSNLESLDVTSTYYDLSQVESFEQLRKLNADFLHVSEVNLTSAGKLEHLDFLSLDAPDVKIADAKPLTSLAQLKWLT